MKIFNILLFIVLFYSCASNDKVEKDDVAKRKAKIYYNQGTNELAQKNYTLALTHLLEANALSPNDPKVLNNLAMAYYFKGRKQTAINIIKKSIKLDPKNTESRQNLGTIYTNMGDYINAERQYNLVLEDLTYQKQYKTYFNLGVLNLKQRRVVEATNYFQQSINENENYCPAYFQLGDIHFKSKSYTKSLEHFKKAGSGVCYNSPRPIYHQALSLIKLKKYGLAKIKLEEVIERFSLTRYQEKASKTLKSLNNKIYSPQLETDSSKGNILSPNF